MQEVVTVANEEVPLGTNDVCLVGRLSVEPTVKELPSGDAMVQVRVVVDRPEASRSRQRVDALDCTIWAARLRGQVAKWHAGDVVEFHGSIRRRFYQTPGGTQSRVEIEVDKARRLQRSAVAK